MLEKSVKFLFKILLMIFTLFGVRYVLSLIGIVIPLEWFIIMVSGMIGFYGVIIIIVYGVLINLMLWANVRQNSSRVVSRITMLGGGVDGKEN